MMRRVVASWVVVGLVLGWGCGSQPEGAAPGAAAPLARVATSEGGMVVSGSEPATRAGAEILARGGNAVDAAVATAFALAVTEPTQSGLGGRTQALVRRPSGETFGVDATTVVPAGYDPDTAEPAEDGYSVIAIPGTVAGLARLLDEGGSMTWADVIGPALRLAEDGFPLSEGEARRFAGIRDRLALSEGARATFVKSDGTDWEAGERFAQPELARVLRALAVEGPGAFYEGWIAEAMVEDFQRHGGAVAAPDLAGYEALPALVVEGRFGTLDLIGTYLPASGATTIEALQILDRVELPGPEAPDRALVMGAALLAAFEDRETARRDPRPPEQDAAWVTSDSLADARASRLASRPARVVGAASVPAGADRETAHTSHLSVVDARGMAVAMTQSLGPTGGSRVATAGLGFLYAATMGYLDRSEPGDRPWSSQSPLIGLRDGRLAVVMGGAGSRRIISAMVGTLVRMEVDGLGLEEAMAAPRFHPSGSWTFERMDSMPEPVGAQAARVAGYTVEIQPSDTWFARLNVITVDPPSGSITGVADPRWAWGAAAGPEAIR
ncbi:MAG TPA: gamma-glutamyltransferase [Longimicrobiales bacterium]|nr:gamma-glutamyltransferase [Longimicrobiales bacterium]